MNIFDMSGDEVYKEVRTDFYDNPNVSPTLRTNGLTRQIIMLCFSMKDEKTFSDLEKWIRELQSAGIDFKRCYVCLVACKSDVKPRKVEKKDGERLAKQYGIDFYVTSAVTGDNVQSMFQAAFKQWFTIYDSSCRDCGIQAS